MSKQTHEVFRNYCLKLVLNGQTYMLSPAENHLYND